MSSASPPPQKKKKIVFSFFLAGKYSNNDPNSKINIEKLLNSCNRSFPFITRRLLFFVSETIAWKNEEQLPKTVEKFQVSGYLLRKWLEREIFSKELQW